MGMRWWQQGSSCEFFTTEEPNSLQELIASLLEATSSSESSTKSRLSAIQLRLSEGNSDEIESVADEEFDL